MKKYTQPVAEEMNMMVACDVNESTPIGNKSGNGDPLTRERAFGSNNFDDEAEGEE